MRRCHRRARPCRRRQREVQSPALPPANHLSSPIGAIAGKTFGIEIEAILHPFDHVACCPHLGLTDGAYDGEPVCDAVKLHSSNPTPEVVIPPRKTVVLSSGDEDEQTDRDRHILELKANGRMAWQRAHDYGRYKSIVGDPLHACHDDAQPVELAIGIKVSNQMMSLAKPDSERGGELPEQ